MKKLKFLPSVLMLAMCIAVLCVGIYAASPTSNTVKGSITVTSMARIKITGYVNDEELFATRNTAAGVEWDLTKSDALKFDALNATTADEVPQKVIRIHIQNLNKDMALGAYFFNGDEGTLEEIDEDTKLATYASLVHEQGIWDENLAEASRTDENMLASSVLSTYTYIAAANADNAYDEVDMYITINVENLSFEDVVGEFIYNLRVEEYRSNVTNEAESASQGDTIDIMTQSEGSGTTKTLMKLPDATESDKKEIVTEHQGSDAWSVVTQTANYYTIPQISDANVGVVVIPSSYTGVVSNTFKDCTSLEHLILPKSIVALSENCLDNTPVLTTLSVANKLCTMTMFANGDYYDSPMAYLFTNRTNADNANSFTSSFDADWYVPNTWSIPNTLKQIYYEGSYVSDYFFIGFFAESMGGRRAIVIGGEVENFGYGSFEDCRGLTNVNLLNRLTQMITFYRCTNLRCITIPDSVTTIGGMTFNNCTSLKSIFIPSTVTTISGTIFAGCSSELIIYTDVVSEDAIPSGWSSNWNYTSSSGGTKLTVNYNQPNPNN